jgi:hypothetical protein
MLAPDGFFPSMAMLNGNGLSLSWLSQSVVVGTSMDTLLVPAVMAGMGPTGLPAFGPGMVGSGPIGGSYMGMSAEAHICTFVGFELRCLGYRDNGSSLSPLGIQQNTSTSFMTPSLLAVGKPGAGADPVQALARTNRGIARCTIIMPPMMPPMMATCGELPLPMGIRPLTVQGVLLSASEVGYAFVNGMGQAQAGIATLAMMPSHINLGPLDSMAPLALSVSSGREVLVAGAENGRLAVLRLVAGAPAPRIEVPSPAITNSSVVASLGRTVNLGGSEHHVVAVARGTQIEVRALPVGCR